MSSLAERAADGTFPSWRSSCLEDLENADESLALWLRLELSSFHIRGLLENRLGHLTTPLLLISEGFGALRQVVATGWKNTWMRD